MCAAAVTERGVAGGTAEPAPAGGRFGSAKRVGALVFVALVVIYALSPTVDNAGDAYLAGPTAASIVTSGNLDLDEFTSAAVVEESALVDHDGHRYDYFPWARALAAVPFAAGLAAGDALGLTPGPVEIADGHPRAWVLSLPPALLTTAAAAALLAAAAWHVARARGRAEAGTVALWVGLGAGLTTGFWSISSRGLWQHGPGVLLLSLALYGAVRLALADRPPPGAARWWALATGFGAAAAVAVRPTFAVFALAIGLWLAWERPPRGLWSMAGAVAGLGPYIVVNLLVFGRPMPRYFDSNRVSLHDDYGEALIGNLVSPARGALVFMPALVVGAVAGLRWWFARGRLDDVRGLDGQSGLRRLVGTLAAGAAMLYFVVAGFPHWWAGFSYGPRFLLDAVPVLVLAAIPAIERLVAAPRRQLVTVAVIVLVGWSAFVNAQGAIVRSAGCWNAQPVTVDEDPSRLWSWSDPLFLAGVRDLASDPVGAIRRSCVDTPADGA